MAKLEYEDSIEDSVEESSELILRVNEGARSKQLRVKLAIERALKRRETLILRGKVSEGVILIGKTLRSDNGSIKGVLARKLVNGKDGSLVRSEVVIWGGANELRSGEIGALLREKKSASKRALKSKKHDVVAKARLEDAKSKRSEASAAVRARREAVRLKNWQARKDRELEQVLLKSKVESLKSNALSNDVLDKKVELKALDRREAFLAGAARAVELSRKNEEQYEAGIARMRNYFERVSESYAHVVAMHANASYTGVLAGKTKKPKRSQKVEKKAH